MKQQKPATPNPAGREGKPISLAPMKFDDALRKILASPPEPKRPKASPKRRAKSSKAKH